jgi:5-methylcytosine-specific restriction endonuclease McrA
VSEGKIGRISRHFKETLRYLDYAQRRHVLHDVTAWATRKTIEKRLTPPERARFKHWLSWKYGPECAYCHRVIDLYAGMTVDHIQPISKGGAVRDIQNMALACMGCNQAKGDAWDGPTA